MLKSAFKNKPHQAPEHVLDRRLNPEYEFLNQHPRGFPTLAERYTEGSVEIHVHLTSGAGQYCAVFYRAVVDESLREAFIVNAKSRQIYGSGNEIKMPMFLDVSKAIKQSQKMIRTVKVPSLVRLQALNLCADRLCHVPQHVPDTVCVPVLGFRAEGESCFAIRGTAASGDETPREMIQNSPIVVERVAQAQGNVLRGDSDVATDAPGVLQSFMLEIVNNYTRLRKPKGQDVLPKHIHVLVRPPKFGLETVLKSPHCGR